MNRTVEQISADIIASKALMDSHWKSMEHHRRASFCLQDQWQEERVKHDDLLNELHKAIYSQVKQVNT